MKITKRLNFFIRTSFDDDDPILVDGLDDGIPFGPDGQILSVLLDLLQVAAHVPVGRLRDLGDPAGQLPDGSVYVQGLLQLLPLPDPPLLTWPRQVLFLLSQWDPFEFGAPSSTFLNFGMT